MIKIGIMLFAFAFMNFIYTEDNFDWDIESDVKDAMPTMHIVNKPLDTPRVIHYPTLEEILRNVIQEQLVPRSPKRKWEDK